MSSSKLPRSVWLLGWASFLTDTASEAIYPLLPLFLTGVLGAGAFSLGLIEGVADATGSVLRVLSGRLSDRWQVRKPLVLAGYSLSSALRPLMATVAAWPQVLALRFADRVGKGIRGAPRDAMLAQIAAPNARGWIYGFHRAMDHAGAVAGPLLASLFLVVYPGQYRTLFALTLVPGIATIVLLLRVSEPSEPAGQRQPMDADPTSGELHRLPRRFTWYLAVLVIFTLGNSTDAFLLLRLSSVGVPAAWIPLLWSLLHVVKAGASLVGGRLSDSLGRRDTIVAGWSIYALVYAGFGIFEAPGPIVGLFLLYGVYFGLTEGPERALVTDLVPANARATAFGLHGAATGLGALLASLIFGTIWELTGAPAAFACGAALAAGAAALLWIVAPSR